MITKYNQYITEKIEEFYSNDSVHIIVDLDENWVVAPDDTDHDNGTTMYYIFPIELLGKEFNRYIVTPHKLDSIMSEINHSIINVENLIDVQHDWDAEIWPQKSIDNAKNYSKLLVSKQNQLSYDIDLYILLLLEKPLSVP